MHKSGLAFLPRLLIINLAATFMAASLILALGSDRIDLPRVWHELEACFLYANSIGTLAYLTLNRFSAGIVCRRGPAKWALVMLWLLVSALVGCLIGGMLAVAAGLGPAQDFWPHYFSTLGFCLVLTIIVGGSTFVYETMQERLERAALEVRTRQLEEERARKLAVEARLSSLESRVHPHFLFNTLNSISSLIPDDPKLAEEMVGKLAALLRFSLDANPRSLAPVHQELRIVKDYLEIEKARFGERLRYSIDVPAELESVELPPLAIQLLVENSVKHVVAQRREGGAIRIAIAASDGRVECEVSDDGPGFRLEEVPAGHGLDNLLQRLNALFCVAAGLQVSHSDGRARVTISVPQRTAEA